MGVEREIQRGRRRRRRALGAGNATSRWSSDYNSVRGRVITYSRGSYYSTSEGTTDTRETHLVLLWFRYSGSSWLFFVPTSSVELRLWKPKATT